MACAETGEEEFVVEFGRREVLLVISGSRSGTVSMKVWEIPAATGVAVVGVGARAKADVGCALPILGVVA